MFINLRLSDKDNDLKAWFDYLSKTEWELSEILDFTLENRINGKAICIGTIGKNLKDFPDKDFCVEIIKEEHIHYLRGLTRKGNTRDILKNVFRQSLAFSNETTVIAKTDPVFSSNKKTSRPPLSLSLSDYLIDLNEQYPLDNFTVKDFLKFLILSLEKDIFENPFLIEQFEIKPHKKKNTENPTRTPKKEEPLVFVNEKTKSVHPLVVEYLKNASTLY